MAPTCDCCLRQMDRMWVYRHRGFCCFAAGRRQEFHAGWWGFCVYCHPLFTERAIQALVARVTTLEPGIAAADAYVVYLILAEVVYGEPVAWVEGEEWSRRRFPVPPPEGEVTL